MKYAIKNGLPFIIIGGILGIGFFVAFVSLTKSIFSEGNSLKTVFADCGWFVLAIAIACVVVAAGIKQIADAEMINKNGITRTAFIVNYEDNFSHTLNDSPALLLVLAYLDNDEIVRLGKMDVGFISENKFALGTTVSIKEYEGKILLLSDCGNKDVPEYLKDAVDAYYEEHGSWEVTRQNM
jgi:hypothetical protein